MIPVIALGSTMMISENKISSTQIKLSEIAAIEGKNEYLISSLSELMSRELNISSAKETKHLSSVTPNKVISERLNKSLDALIDSSNDVPEITGLLQQLKPKIDQLISIDQSFEDKTRQLFQIQLSIDELNLQIRKSTTSVSTQAQQIVDTQAEKTKKQSNNLKGIMNDPQVFTDNGKLADLREILQRLQLSNGEKLQQASSQIRRNIIKLASIGHQINLVRNPAELDKLLSEDANIVIKEIGEENFLSPSALFNPDLQENLSTIQQFKT